VAVAKPPERVDVDEPPATVDEPSLELAAPDQREDALNREGEPASDCWQWQPGSGVASVWSVVYVVVHGDASSSLEF
jgi:hypothetical protein